VQPINTVVSPASFAECRSPALVPLVTAHHTPVADPPDIGNVSTDLLLLSDGISVLSPPYLTMGLRLCLTDMIVMSAYALVAVRLARWLHDPKSIRLQNRLFGGLFVSAGALLAISSRT